MEQDILDNKMRKYKIKIQSYSNIITNSSSELYTIKTDLSVEEFRKIWDKQLDDWGIRQDPYYTPGDETFEGRIYKEDNYLVLDYLVLCNLDQNIELKLQEWFGKNNVISEI